MEQDKTPVNFDFLNEQQSPEPKPGLDKRIIVIIVMFVALIFVVGLSFLLSDKKDTAEQVTSVSDTEAAADAQEFVDSFHSNIRQDKIDAAYQMLNEQLRPPVNLFKSSAGFLKDKVDTTSCAVDKTIELDSGYKLVYNCPYTTRDGSIQIEYTVIGAGTGLSIAQYTSTGLENETSN